MDLPNIKTDSLDGMSISITEASPGFWDRISITALQTTPGNNKLRIVKVCIP